jgi:hypothetical protein
MKSRIDITGEKFDKIDFSESEIIDFYCQENMPHEFKFTIWGATLWLSQKWDDHRPRFTKDELMFKKPHDVDMYVSGIGTITITRLTGGYIDISPYGNIRDENGCTVFARDADNSIITYKRSWNLGNTGKYDEYLWELTMAWPPAACVIYLYSDNGTVSYEFDDADIIDADLYIQQPREYSYKRNAGNIERPIPRALLKNSEVP